MATMDFSTPQRGTLEYWKSDRTYRAGHTVLNPSGILVSANVGHISSNEYNSDTPLWEGVSQEVFIDRPTGADDTSMLNSAIALSAGKNVMLRQGETYIISSTVLVPSGTKVDLNGATIDARTIPIATALGQRVAIQSIGVRDASLAISTAIAVNSRVVTGISSTTGLLAGDLILIRNEESPIPGLTRGDRDKGELNVISSVDSASQVTLNIGVMFDYGSTSLVLHRINPVKNVEIKNGSILMGGVGSGHCGIQIQYGRNIDISNVNIDGAEDTSVNLRSVWNGKVSRGKMENATSSPTLGTSGYGVCIVEGSRFCLADKVEFINCRHFVTGGGFWPASDIVIKNCFGIGSLNAAYDTHESCFNWVFDGNQASGCAGGFGMRGQYVTVINSMVRDSTGVAYSARTFDGVTEQRGIVFNNNIAIRCSGGGVSFEGSAIGAEPTCLKIDCEASGNTITDCGAVTTDAFIVRHFNGMKLRHNTVQRSGRNGMYIVGLVGTQSKNLSIEGNYVSDSVNHGYELQYIDDISYSGGQITNPVKNGINVTNCNNVGYNSPSIVTPGNAGLSITGGAKHSVSNPMILGGANATYDAIRVSGSSDFSVNGGTLGSARNAIYSTTTEYVIVQGVNARAALSGTKINVDAINKSVANNLV